MLCLVCLFDFDKLVRGWDVALCLAILKSLRILLLHKQSRCGHVLCHYYDIMYNWDWYMFFGQKMFFVWLPMFGQIRT